VEYETENRHYAHVDCPGHGGLHQEHDYGCGADGWRIWLSRRRMVRCRRTREHVLLPQVGVPSIVVALNKSDMVDDEEILELVELEVRELLNEYEFPV